MTAPAQTQSIFDQSHYLAHIEARGQLIRRLVPRLKHDLGLVTAIDSGCGVGFFAGLLSECGLDVKAFDGRENNVEEARKRYPDISFEQGDIEDKSIVGLGSFDLVLCFGLLYHLENPLRAIRNLRALTGSVLLLESMCLPQYEPLVLLREEPSLDDQSLTDLAFYPSEGCIVKMLYRAGYAAVYRVAVLPDHDDFRETSDHARRRTTLVASLEPLTTPGLVPLREPEEPGDPWEKNSLSQLTRAQRVKRFLTSPVRQKYVVLVRHLHRRFPRAALPIPLPFGAWWLARDDHVSRPIVENRFETAEFSFMRRHLQPGMKVLDIGAHHGFYSLLASRSVGDSGRVYSFEPSLRERRALLKHVRLNRCRNVSVQDIALGDRNGRASLFVVEGSQTGCNSLKPPIVDTQASAESVRVSRLDDWLSEQKFDHVDFVKLDVEGGELGVLNGAQRLLERQPRPIILAEVQDLRTYSWSYKAKDIIELLRQKDYKWFRLLEDGSIAELDVTRPAFDGNFVACPAEAEDTFWQAMRSSNES
jgi:tRNA (mo5U34)-methyltransferase